MGHTLDRERIKHIFQFMEYDYLTEAQENLIISLESKFLKRHWLSNDQVEILEDIFKKAAEKVEWSR